MFYVLVCRDCTDDLPIPFDTAAERGRWASRHTEGAGHDRYLVLDQPAQSAPTPESAS